MLNQIYGISQPKPSLLIGIFLFVVVIFLYYIFYFTFGYKTVTEGATGSQDVTNNAYMTNIDTQLDDLMNKIKNVQNTYENMNTVLQFGTIEKNDDPTADPEMYIDGDPPNQSIRLKLPRGLKGPVGCKGPAGNTGSPGSRGDLGKQGATGLNVMPSFIKKRPLTSIE